MPELYAQLRETMANPDVSIAELTTIIEIKIKSKVLPVQWFMAYSIAVAACSKQIAIHESCANELTDSCFLEGMLHDIGKLVLLANLHEQYDTTVNWIEVI